MSRAKRMQYIAELAGRRVHDAARRLGEARHAVVSHETQLAELERYRQEYAEAPNAPGRPAVVAYDLQNRQRFMARLDNAVVEQQRVIQRGRHTLEQERQHWLACRTRTQALEKLADRYLSSEEQVAARREQFEVDDGYRPSRTWQED